MNNPPTTYELWVCTYSRELVGTYCVLTGIRVYSINVGLEHVRYIIGGQKKK